MWHTEGFRKWCLSLLITSKVVQVLETDSGLSCCIIAGEHSRPQCNYNCSKEQRDAFNSSGISLVEVLYDRGSHGGKL